MNVPPPATVVPDAAPLIVVVRPMALPATLTEGAGICVRGPFGPASAY
jgi:hypothetical protein